jgi:heptosyltransferase-1
LAGDEHARSERIASGIARTRVPERQPIDAVARLIAGASVVVGVDTGLLHLAAAFGVPLVAIFSGSEPALTDRAAGADQVLEGRDPVPVKRLLPAVEAIMEPPRISR